MVEEQEVKQLIKNLKFLGYDDDEITAKISRKFDIRGGDVRYLLWEMGYLKRNENKRAERKN